MLNDETAYGRWQSAVAAAFPYVQRASKDCRARICFILSKHGVRRGRDFRIEQGLLTDAYRFRRARDAVTFRLWFGDSRHQAVVQGVSSISNGARMGGTIPSDK